MDWPVSDDPPSIEFEDEIRGHGVLASEEREISAPDFSIRRPKYGKTGAWDVRVHIDADYPERRAVLSGSEPLTLTGQSDGGRAVSVEEFHLKWNSQRRLEGWCYEVEVGADTLPEPPDDQRVVITFSDTPVAQPEIRFPVRTGKGEMKSMNDRKVEPFRIPTALGEAKFARKYEWEDVSVGGNRASVRIPAPTLWLELDGDATRKQPLDILRDLHDDLRWFERLLSFLNRKHTAWLLGVVASRWDGDPPVEHPPEAKHWRTGVVGDPSVEVVERPFVVPGRMDPVDLGNLLDSLRGLDYSEFVFHGIGHLIGAVSERFVEGQMMNAFTALEAVVSGWCRAQDREFIADADSHNEIRARVKNELEEAVEAHPAIPNQREDDVYDALRRKMAGSHTRRRSFADRARDTVNGSGAEWSDLWPEDTDLRRAISQAYGRRSKLVHEGRRSDEPPISVDIMRIHALTERIVFNLIDGDAAWVGPGAYSHCGRLRQYDV